MKSATRFLSLVLLASFSLTATTAEQRPMPQLSGGTAWLNSQPLDRAALRGKVVLIDFWTYTCINCLRALPYVKAWDAKYRDAGLVVIGVHTPEFDFEGDKANVEMAVRKYGIRYPVVVDKNRKIWNAFHNQFWPAHYFVDAKGQIRAEHFGEGEYEASENTIRALLAEAGLKPTSKSALPAGTGEQAAADIASIRSPETYVGYERADGFASRPRAVPDRVQQYSVAKVPALNQWGLSGRWRIGAESAVLQSAPGKIVFRFHARDLHLVMGPGDAGIPVRFKVRLSGADPGANHGVDIGADGSGTVAERRLYQLIRQTGAVTDQTFEIEFLDAGAVAFSFTFG